MQSRFVIKSCMMESESVDFSRLTPECHQQVEDACGISQTIIDEKSESKRKGSGKGRKAKRGDVYFQYLNLLDKTAKSKPQKWARRKQQRIENEFADLQKIKLTGDPVMLFCALMDTIAFTVKEFTFPSVQSTEVWVDSPRKIMKFKTVIKMEWPEVFEVEIFERRKRNSYGVACLRFCDKLQELGVLDHTYEPLMPKTKDYPCVMKEAKMDLEYIFKRIKLLTGNNDIRANYEIILPADPLNCCTCLLTVTYPEEMTFRSVALLAKNAEFMAASEALLWLRSRSITRKKQVSIDRPKDNLIEMKKSYSTPSLIQLPSDVQEEMQNLLNNTENFVSSECSRMNSSFEYNVKSVATDNSIWPTEGEVDYRNQMLCESNEIERNCLLPVNGIQKAKSLLPISQRRGEILKVIYENRVVVLTGDTSCGKSTQVPQFILDDYITRKKGSKCNIIVAEPTSISATSLAERVASERGEEVGDTVGYHVRLRKCLPQSVNGSISFYTAGMMIWKLSANPNLKSISHVIIDEAHERHIETDFILILLKDILQINEYIKIIIMSASMNTHIFAQYFNSCPIIHIDGKMHPVEEYFLEDLIEIIPSINLEQEKAVLNVDLVVNVIIQIDKTQSKGAILCFLPGWYDLKSVQSKLLNHKENKSLFVCLIHSKLPHEKQINIFCPPPRGHRKVILATNISESSITVNDVVYVVNSGLHKVTEFDKEMCTVALKTQWITKANVQQRKGRTGRIKVGKCYNLFSRKVFAAMENYPVAEILRVPLESVVLKCKLFYPEKKVEDILLKALQPPNSTSVQKGIKELQGLEIFDDKENLTTLGEVVGKISVHPRLAVALVYATFLGCLDPVLTICVILSLEKEPFLNILENKSLNKKVKQVHNDGLCSDYLSLINMYDMWVTSSTDADATKYLEDNLLDGQCFCYIKELKELLATNLCATGFIPSPDSYCDKFYVFNANSCHPPSILASLTAAFFPNVLKSVQGKMIKGKIKTNSVAYSTVIGNSAHIQKESVISNEKVLPSPWLIFFKAFKSEARKMALIVSASSVPTICLLLFSRGSIIIKKVTNLNKNKEDMSISSFLEYETLKFLCTEKEALLLLNCRERLNDIFNLYLENFKNGWDNADFLSFYINKFIPTFNKILDAPEVPFQIK